jgi:hypothetical protein
MGVMSTVLLLPLAPVRGVTWIAELLDGEADRELAATQSPARSLDELAAALAAGEISPEEAERLETEIVERMLAGHGAAAGP